KASYALMQGAVQARYALTHEPLFGLLANPLHSLQLDIVDHRCSHIRPPPRYRVQRRPVRVDRSIRRRAHRYLLGAATPARGGQQEEPQNQKMSPAAMLQGQSSSLTSG